MSTRVVYAGLGANFAFRIGGEFNPGKIEGSHLLDLAESLGVAPRYLMKIASDTIMYLFEYLIINNVKQAK